VAQRQKALFEAIGLQSIAQEIIPQEHQNPATNAGQEYADNVFEQLAEEIANGATRIIDAS